MQVFLGIAFLYKLRYFDGIVHYHLDIMKYLTRKWCSISESRVINVDRSSDQII